MIFEIIEFQVKAGMQDVFVQGTADSRSLFQQARGFQGLKLHHEIDDPLKFIILVKWASVQHHLDLQNTSLHQQIRDKVIDCFSAPPKIRYSTVQLQY